MVNEAVMLVRKLPPTNFTVVDGTAIEKGSILKVADLNIASKSVGDADMVAGIAANEKIADDGVTSIAVYEDGIVRVKASGSISVGQECETACTLTDNTVVAVSTRASGGTILGVARETASAGETFRLKLTCS